jgi:hypothetical protein
VAGDLNLAPSAHDRTSENDNDKERSLFANILEKTGLVDGFRQVNPVETTPPAFSFHRHTTPKTSSRIDHILIDPALQNSILGAKILLHKSHIASDTGDHRMVIIHLRRSNIFGAAPPPHPPRKPDPRPLFDHLNTAGWSETQHEAAKQLMSAGKDKFDKLATELERAIETRTNRSKPEWENALQTYYNDWSNNLIETLHELAPVPTDRVFRPPSNPLTKKEHP